MSRTIFAVLAAIVLTTAGLAAWLYLGLVRPAPPRAQPAVVRIDNGEPLRNVAERLAAEGLVRDATLFTWLARWRELDRRIRSGEYEMPGGQTPDEVLDALAFGRRRLFMVTVPEGLTAAEIATLLEAADLGRAESFRALARDPTYARSLGLPGDPSDLEGYLFPDTYAFRSDAPPEETIARMARRFTEVFDPAMQQAARDVGLTVHQAVTLASMIEEEAAIAAERPTISAVFHNRLRRGMPLQSDPTAVYGVEGRAGPVTRADLARPTSHNTYRIAGLPPGPIANPGRASLLAAVHPAADVSALYFVARNDRTHEFSDTLEAHHRAVERYRRAAPVAPGSAASGVAPSATAEPPAR